MGWFEQMLAAGISGGGSDPTYTYTDPASLSGLQFLLDANSTAGMTLTGTGSDELSQYIERSNNGYTGTQAMSTKRPKRVTNVLDGQAVLRFDGSDDWLSFGDVLDMGASAWTWIILSKTNSTEGAILSKSVAADAPNRFSLLYTGGQVYNLLHLSSVYNVTENAVSGSFQALEASFARTGSAQIFMRQNKVMSNPTGAYLNSTDLTYNADSVYRFLLGAYNNASDTGEILPFNGDIAYIAGFNRFLTIAEFKAIYNHLKQRFPSLSYSLEAD